MSDFGPYQLLNCYANGIFPMSESRDDPEIFFVDPDKRGVFPLDGLNISKSLAKTVRSGRFEIKVDTGFLDVVKACAEPRPDHPETWINQSIIDLYVQLHQLGHAHSIECWHDDQLLGGLYGVSLGTAFFGESMFSRENNASKVALVHLVGRLKAGGYTLLDSQFITDHLLSLGAIEISREAYHQQLEAALELQGEFYPQGYSDVDYRKSVRPGGTRQSNTQIS